MTRTHATGTDEAAHQDRKDEKSRLFTEVPGLHYRQGALEPREISLAKEVPFALFVNDREILSIATLPTHLEELFVGFLVSEGVLLRLEELSECAVDYDSHLVRIELDMPEERLANLERKGMLTSGCAGGMVFSVESAMAPKSVRSQRLKLRCSDVMTRMQDLDTFPGMYRITRGVHAASVADATSTLVILEDLGRHNAVDKIVGYCFLNQVPTQDKLLLTTGRITSEVLTKAARSNFPMVVSRSSASAMAVAMAQQQGIDVVTYVRGGRFNYFPHGATELAAE